MKNNINIYKFPTDNFFLYFCGTSTISNDWHLIDSSYWVNKTIGGSITDCPKVYYICG
jgi:hypothetical protein